MPSNNFHRLLQAPIMLRMSDAAQVITRSEQVTKTGPAPQVLWLRVMHASVSSQVVRTAQGMVLIVALGLFGWLAWVPGPQRQQFAVDAALKFISSNPPWDAILAQLPPERMPSVHSRIAAQVDRLLVPSVVGAGVLLLIAAAAYGWIAREVRTRLGSLQIQPMERARWSAQARALFWVVTVLGLAAHVPYALDSIRFDEDGAALISTRGWFAWANNVSGWSNHVGALFTIRLSTALFGMNELSVRAPAIIASSLALAYLCTELRNRVSLWSGAITGALCLAIPLWAEQTALARGYGLTFCAAALIMVGLLHLDDEQEQPSTRTMSCLFAGVFIGCLAHVFFAFTAVGLMVWIALSRQRSPALRVVMLWWLVLAALLPGVSALVGLPSSLVALNQTSETPMAAVVERFVEELRFRHTGLAGNLLMTLCLTALAGALIALPKRARIAGMAIGGFGLLGPLVGNSIYVYPRFFLHLLPFALPCVAWFISVRALRGRNLANALVVVGLVGLWASTRPLQRPTFVDLRSAAKLAREEAARHREHFAIDTFISTSMRFYNGTPGRIVNSAHPIPSDVERLLMAVPHNRNNNIPAGFLVERRLPGTESDILLLSKRR